MDSQAYDRMFAIESDMWWYRGRRAVCMALLERVFRPDPGRRILDVGCGTGFNMALLRRLGQVQGVDMAPEALEYCRRRGMTQVQQADATSLPFSARSFDLVTAFDIVEHVQDDLGALREFYRVLVPGGRLLVYTPALPWLYGEHDRIVHHVRRYRRQELTDKIQQAGFELEHLSYVNLLVLPVVLLARLVLDRLSRRPHAEMSVPPRPANSLLTRLCLWEAPWVTGPGLPYGMTLVALARRPQERQRLNLPQEGIREQVPA